jgi:hypothetical protein
MKNISKAKIEFNQKLDELQKEIQPALYGPNLKEIVIYEKLMEMQEQINKMLGKVDKNN